MKLILRSLHSVNLCRISEWCLDYHQNTLYPAHTSKRFAIAFYQIYQGIEWQRASRNNDNMYESFASAALHFIMVNESLDLPGIWTHVYWMLDDNERFVTKPIDYEQLTYLLSAAQQQLLYKFNNNNTSRKSRYSAGKLSKMLTEAIMMLFQAIPSHRRADAIEMATDIMTKRL